MLLGLLDDYWIGTAWLNPCLWLRMGIWSVRVTEVKEQADASDVQQGRVRLEDQVG